MVMSGTGHRYKRVPLRGGRAGFDMDDTPIPREFALAVEERRAAEGKGLRAIRSLNLDLESVEGGTVVQERLQLSDIGI